MDRRTRFSPSAALIVGAAVLVVLQSVQLVRTKQARAEEALERAALRATIHLGTRAFLEGTVLPSVAVQAEGGRTATLDEICQTSRRLVVILTDATCPACADVAPDWQGLARERKDLDVVAVHVGAVPGEPGPTGVRNFQLALQQPAEAARSRPVPALIVADSSCRVAAAGAGRVAVGALLEELAAGTL